jgi:hypothetical protein
MFQTTFTRVRELAFSTSGLNYASGDVIRFVTDWTNNNPCAIADEFIRNILRLKSFVFATTDLNYASTDATRFALEKEPSFCSEYPVESEFGRHFSFAFSTSGMNMSGTDARRYALRQIEREAFFCSNL